MVDVFTQITIDKPIAEVSAYAVDPDNAPKWYVNIKSARWETPKPLTIGSRIAFTAKFLGKEMAYTYEIAAYIPTQKLVMRTAQGPFPMETTYTWSAISDKQTVMTLRNVGHPTGFSSIFAPFMSMMMKKANRKDLQLIKDIIEG